VRVHVDDAAHAAAGSMHARALTVGNQIVFGESECAPSTSSGRRLLAHELAHVAQQGGRAQGVIQRQVAENMPPPDFGEIEMGRKKNPPGWIPLTGTTCSAIVLPGHVLHAVLESEPRSYHLAKNGPLLLAGIAAAVGTRCFRCGATIWVVAPLHRTSRHGMAAISRHRPRPIGSPFSSSMSCGRS
jgi:hypothetical protein